jgi:hypothetical protein
MTYKNREKLVNFLTLSPSLAILNHCMCNWCLVSCNKRNLFFGLLPWLACLNDNVDPSYRRSLQPSKYPALQYMKFQSFLLFLWVIFVLLDPDSGSKDPEPDSLSTDLIKSGSNSYPKNAAFFESWKYFCWPAKLPQKKFILADSGSSGWLGWGWS